MQVNPWQTPRLYQRIVELAELSPSDIVYDLYCGAGTISAYAARLAKKVIGIEYVAEAVQHATETARLNSLDNLQFFAGDMKDLLCAEFFEHHGLPDVIIVDPPRNGLHPDVARCLCTIKPRTLIYVACKASSLARDLAILSTAYKVEQIQSIDLMPQTLHVETIAVLKPLA
jgi:23S rRNA (uracil1939-C5)-methyltransferase